MFNPDFNTKIHNKGIAQWLKSPGVLNNAEALEKLRHTKNPIDAARISYDHIEDGYDPKEPVRVNSYDFSLKGHNNIVELRIYLPKDREDIIDMGGLFYIHGGGYVSGSLRSHNKICEEIAQYARCAVVAINYRLAPENIYPANIEDCLLFAKHIKSISESYKVNHDKWVIGGDSAGSAISTAVLLALREQNQSLFKGQLHYYGNFDCNYNTASMIKYQHGPVLSRDSIMDVHKAVLGVENISQNSHPEMFVLQNPSLKGLPPAYIASCELCQFSSENLKYHEALKRAGVDSFIDELPEMPHGYLHARHISEEAMKHFKNSLKHLQRLINS